MPHGRGRLLPEDIKLQWVIWINDICHQVQVPAATEIVREYEGPLVKGQEQVGAAHQHKLPAIRAIGGRNRQRHATYTEAGDMGCGHCDY